MPMKDADGLREMGRLFGYPECCIESVVEGAGCSPEGVPNKYIGTGFTPCHACQTTKTMDELIAEINSNRTYKQPFPMSLHGLDVLSKKVVDDVLSDFERVIRANFAEDLEGFKKHMSEENALRWLTMELYFCGDTAEYLENRGFYNSDVSLAASD